MRTILLPIAALLALCVFLPLRAQASQAGPGDTTAYTLKQGDVLSVSVWGFPDLSVSSLTVRPDGKITYPTIGDIYVVGLTPETLAKRIEDGVSKFVKNPRVTVSLSSTPSDRYFVAGSVARPGTYPLVAGTGVKEAIAAAGDFTDDANRFSAVILREGKTIPVDLKAAFEGDTGANVPIMANDTLTISQALVNIIGAVTTTGKMPLRRGSTLAQAIAAAGGTRADADIDKVLIMRGGTGGQVLAASLREIASDPKKDIVLLPDDTVQVNTVDVRQLTAFVTGAVGRTGVYRWTPGWRGTLEDAVNAATPASAADLARVKVKREWIKGHSSVRVFDLQTLEGRQLPLEENDYIDVSRKRTKSMKLTPIAATLGTIAAVYSAFFKK
jgi:polysaccharide export outer membrane protein